MSGPDSHLDPYAPPATREHVVSDKDTLLRRLGALSLGYVIVRLLLRPPLGLQEALGGSAILAVCIYGFLRGGRRFHLGIALWMGLTMWVQGYFVSRAIAHPERLPVDIGPHPWWDFVLGIVPLIIALVCASALYVRAWRAKAAGS